MLRVTTTDLHVHMVIQVTLLMVIASVYYAHITKDAQKFMIGQSEKNTNALQRSDPVDAFLQKTNS